MFQQLQYILIIKTISIDTYYFGEFAKQKY